MREPNRTIQKASMIAVGVAIGFAMHNIAIGVAIGVALWVAFSAGEKKTRPGD